MSILTTVEVASFLGLESNSPGLQDAIEQAEILTAGKLNLPALQFGVYEETQLLRYTVQQVIPRNGPIREVTEFIYDGEDVTEKVFASIWSIGWGNPYRVDFDRVRSFDRAKVVSFTYSAGWTNSSGDYPIPAQVAEYVKMMTGLTYQNFLGSGVYDTKLGDMTVKIQREVLDKNLRVYDNALRIHARP
jgi:hypothetical protein